MAAMLLSLLLTLLLAGAASANAAPAGLAPAPYGAHGERESARALALSQARLSPRCARASLGLLPFLPAAPPPGDHARGGAAAGPGRGAVAWAAGAAIP